MTIFVNMLNLGQFREKTDILSKTALLKFKSKNPFAHNVTHVTVTITVNLPHTMFWFLQTCFVINTFK